KPVIEKLPGWKCDIRGIRKYEDLPENCRKYIEFVEEKIGYPITLVSNGPGREDIIYRYRKTRKSGCMMIHHAAVLDVRNKWFRAVLKSIKAEFRLPQLLQPLRSARWKTELHRYEPCAGRTYRYGTVRSLLQLYTGVPRRGEISGNPVRHVPRSRQEQAGVSAQLHRHGFPWRKARELYQEQGSRR